MTGVAEGNAEDGDHMTLFVETGPPNQYYAPADRTTRNLR